MSFDDRVSEAQVRQMDGRSWIRRHLVVLVLAGVAASIAAFIVYASLDDSIRTSAFRCEKALNGEPIETTYERQTELIEKCVAEGYR